MRLLKSENQEKSTTWIHFSFLALATICLGIALFSYHPEDPSFQAADKLWQKPHNSLGYLGAWTSACFFFLLGLSSWAIPIVLSFTLLAWAKNPERKEKKIFNLYSLIATLSLVTGLCFLLSMTQNNQLDTGFPTQGLWGLFLQKNISPFIGQTGSYIFIAILLYAGLLLLQPNLFQNLISFFQRNYSQPLNLFSKFFLGLKSIFTWPQKIFSKLKFQKNAAIEEGTEEPHLNFTESFEEKLEEHEEEEEIEEKAPRFSLFKVFEKSISAPAKRTRSKTKAKATGQPNTWELPKYSLLKKSINLKTQVSKDVLLTQSKKITEALNSFDIHGDIVEISPGPIITMFEFQPAPGTRVNKIVNISTDLAMSLGVPSVRIVAPIPGKSVAGIEVPNPDREDIFLRDILESTQEKASTQKIPLMIGKDAEGTPVVEDLARMPHLLVGGATNMGKSVLINSILTGILCRFSPKELQLIIVDPKLVEFKIYEDIPHLLLPIVNDAKDASQALKWAVAETKRRYFSMQKLSAKNLESYNSKVDDWELDGRDPEEKPQRIPYILIIVDELAELMLTAKKDVEQSIVRLTQLARAAGIHMIMATQRPSADVVTGLIKSNCPSRASLRVASSMDSRIIMDCTGAELLLGRGDMFFTSSGPMGLRRMQGAFVSDDEVEGICDHWRAQGEPNYQNEILSENSHEETLSDEDNRDALYKDILQFARDRGAISTSLIQRRFQIGYTRAARIMEQMEDAGVVSEQQSAGKPREVLI